MVSRKWVAVDGRIEQFKKCSNYRPTRLESEGKHVIDAKSTGTPLHCHQPMISSLMIGLVSYLFGLNTKFFVLYYFQNI